MEKEEKEEEKEKEEKEEVGRGKMEKSQLDDLN